MKITTKSFMLTITLNNKQYIYDSYDANTFTPILNALEPDIKYFAYISQISNMDKDDICQELRFRCFTSIRHFKKKLSNARTFFAAVMRGHIKNLVKAQYCDKRKININLQEFDAKVVNKIADLSIDFYKKDI